MDIDKVKKMFTLFLTAFGIFILIFLTYSIIVISKIAQKKDRKEIKKGYAEESISVTPSQPVSE